MFFKDLSVLMSQTYPDGEWQGFIRCGGGTYPRHEFDMGGISPVSVRFFLKSFSGFENLITKCNFKAFRSKIKHFNVLKTHQGVSFLAETLNGVARQINKITFNINLVLALVTILV
jgi:hypothetical protein